MFNIILSWAVPFACGGAAGLACTILAKMKAQREGLQCLLRAEIIRSYDKYIDRGYCPIYARESLDKAYNAYHALGGNDVATKLYREITELPTDKK